MKLSGLFKKQAEEKPADGEVKQWSMTPREAKKRAAMMVKSAARLGVLLNYSPETMATVDMLIDKERETKVGLTPEMHIVLRSLGAYAGEVLIKNLDGKWIETPGIPTQDPLVVVVGGRYAVNVVSIVFRRFISGDPVSLAKMYEETARFKEGKTD